MFNKIAVPGDRAFGNHPFVVPRFHSGLVVPKGGNHLVRIRFPTVGTTLAVWEPPLQMPGITELKNAKWFPRVGTGSAAKVVPGGGCIDTPPGTNAVVVKKSDAGRQL